MYHKNIGFKIAITYLPNSYVLASKKYPRSHIQHIWSKLTFIIVIFFLTYICEEMVLALAM